MCGRGDEYRLETQFINNSLPASDEYPVRMFVNISYSFSNCSSGVNGCNSFIVFKRFVPHEHGCQSSGDGVIPDNRIRNGTTSGTQQFSFNMTKCSGVSLVAHSLRVCVAVLRLLVYRYECADHRMGLGHLPATQAPISGTISVIPQCAEHSHPINNMNCTAQGKWLGDLNNSCECDLGYLKYHDTCIKAFTPAMEMYSVIEAQEKIEVCFKVISQYTGGSVLHIVTHDGNAIGKYTLLIMVVFL